MTQPAGFGKPKNPPKKAPTAAAQKRAAAERQFEDMKTSGMPEYEIFVRIAGQQQWLPVGAIAVRRSTQIHNAIYANEEGLLSGAYHRMPALKKSRDKLTLEYGYRLKEFKDEPIQVAVKPVPGVGNAISGAIANVGAAIGNLLQKKG
ncbi:MAG: hypothetical protein RLZZ511_2879 [Cyanobacteriota bacterium]|jgi:Family of unknown function (DUF6523)